MRKHIFGFALFSLIFAAFALIFAVFYAPSIPLNEVVKSPLLETHEVTPTGCYPKSLQDFTYEIVSANYFAKKGKLVTEVKLNWNGDNEFPKEINIQPRIFTIDNFDKEFPLRQKNLVEKSTLLKIQTLTNPFALGYSKTFVIESKYVIVGKEIESRYVIVGKERVLPNLYVAYDFSESANEILLTNKKAGFAEAVQVLFVHSDKPDNLEYADTPK